MNMFSNTIRHLDNVYQKTLPMDVPYEKELRKTIKPRLLYITLLLHDIGKSDGIKGHAESGLSSTTRARSTWH